MATKKNSKKSQQKQQLEQKMRLTTYFGYGLFIVSAIALCVSIIPWFNLYTYPSSEFLQVTLGIVAFAFAAVAAPLVGYLVGDSATRGASKLLHHYNGVLFGVLGIWLWLAASMFMTILSWWSIVIENNFQNVLFTIAPAAIAALIAIILGIFYARSTKHQALLTTYRPYRWTLFIAPVWLIVSVGFSALTSLQYGANPAMSMLITLIMPLLFILVATLLGYWIVGKKSGTAGERVVYSLTAIAYGVMTITIVGQLVHFLGQDQPSATYAYGFIIAVIIWLSYLYLLRRISK